MSSDVQICNVALAMIGEPAILSLTEDSKPGRACNLIYNDIREAVLRDHHWNFAMERVELAQMTSTPSWGYSYQYQLPSDCLKVVRMDPEGNDIKFRIEGRKLLTDESSVYILYVKDVTDPTQFDPLFREALSNRLAAELAVSITGNLELSDYQRNLYTMKLNAARSVDAQEGTPEGLEADLWLNSRL